VDGSFILLRDVLLLKGIMMKIKISGVSGFVHLLGVTSSPILQLELHFCLAAWAQSEYHGLGVHALFNRLQDVSG
jgi:hypothetical protein